MRISKKTRQIALTDEVKLPTRKTTEYVGVELEFFSDRHRLEFIQMFVKHKVDKYVNIGYDSSVIPDICDEYGEEIMSIYEEPHYKDWDEGYHWGCYEVRILCPYPKASIVIPKICSIIKTLNGQVNDSCGMHVHLDMRSKEKIRDLEFIYDNFLSCQRLLFSLCEPHREDNVEMCEANDEEYKEYCSFEENLNNSYRYNAININAYFKYKTYEIRVHEGTLNSREILNFIDLLQTIKHSEKKIDPIYTKRDLKNLKLSGRLQRYVRNSRL